MKNNVVAIIQARVGSQRLPGKVMMTLEDRTVLNHIVSRIKTVKGIDKIIIATSELTQDDIIQKEANFLQVLCFRGSEKNVLERFYFAAKSTDANIIIRITSDCPFVDPELLTRMLDFHAKMKVDYLSNCLERTFPRGLDLEIFSMQALERTYFNACAEYEKEHVTPYIYKNPLLFHLLNYKNDIDLSVHRWTLDTIEDFNFISLVYKELYPQNNLFNTKEILQLLYQKPWLGEINNKVVQKELINL